MAPGQRLMCIWEVLATLDKAGSGAPNTALVQETTLFFTSLLRNPGVSYSAEVFQQWFPGPLVEFSAYKRYVLESLRDAAIQRYLVEEAIEGVCWEMCKKTYLIQDFRYAEDDLRKLWLIYIRLLDTGSYPPVTNKDEAEWLAEQVASGLHKPMPVDMFVSQSFYCFQELFAILEDRLLKDVPLDWVKHCLDELHMWLVKEINMEGWMYKRTRKQSNWTNWVKRWFVLTPGMLTYYENSNLKEKKGKVIISAKSVITSLPAYRGLVHRLEGRLKITNSPNLEIELCTDKDREKMEWILALESVKDASTVGTTPVQDLLQKRFTFKRKTINNDMLADTNQRLSKLRATACKRPRHDVKEWRCKSQTDAVSKEEEESSNGMDESPHASPVIIRKSPKIKPERKNSHAGTHQISPKVQRKCSLDAADSLNNRLFIAHQLYKLQTLFDRIDRNNDEHIEKEEFWGFIAGLGLTMTKSEVNVLFARVDQTGEGKLSLKDFCNYFFVYVVDEKGGQHWADSRLRAAFLKADFDGTGDFDFREFTEFIWERRRLARLKDLFRDLATITNKEDEDAFGPTKFVEVLEADGSIQFIFGQDDTDLSEDNLSQHLRSVPNDDVDAEEYLAALTTKWKSFRRHLSKLPQEMHSLRRVSSTGLPSGWNLVDLMCFSTLKSIEPRHVAVKGMKWVHANERASDWLGKCIFPPDFDGKVPLALATSDHLRYYNCCLADSLQVQVSLLYRHGLIEYNVQNQHLTKYMPEDSIGSGLERHDFSHLDCPLEDDSGYFLLGKMVGEDELHLTGFQIPTRHSLYIARGTIHSNDYLRGSWKTMLCDEDDIDHASVVRRSSDNHTKSFFFEFIHYV